MLKDEVDWIYAYSDAYHINFCKQLIHGQLF